MKRYSKFLEGFLFAVALFLVLLQGPVTARAEVVETDLLTVEKEEDFTVMFEYEGERPEIVFISPSGKEYGEGLSAETELVYAHGEGWSTYKVIAAECGTWKIRCDKKNNAYVEYGFISVVDGLAIQSFHVVSLEERQAVLNFDVTMGEDEVIQYHYTVSAIAGENTGGKKEVISGYASTGTPTEITVGLNLSSYDDYRFLLEVTAKQGLEMYDSMMSDSFEYVNPDSSKKIEDVYVLLNLSMQKCELDWSKYGTGWDSEYYLVVYTDADSENPIYTNTTTNCQEVFFYPTDAKKVIINLYYKNNGILSEVLEKEINLVNGEKLQIVTPEVTAASQLELAFKNEARTILSVRVNEQSGTYNLMEPGSLYFPLQPGVNSVEAFFQGVNNITYYVSDNIFLDTTPPELILYENFDGMTFKKSDVVISGALNNAVKLLINELEVTPDEDGVFTHTVTLTAGENNIVLVAESAAGVRIQRSMKVIKADDVTTEVTKEYLPLLISAGAVLVLLIFVLCVIGRKKNRTAMRVYTRFAIGFGIIVTLLETGCVFLYRYLQQFNNSREYVELARKSVVEAAKYLDYQEYILQAIYILAGVLGLNLVVGIIVRVIVMVVKKLRQKKIME